MEVQSRTYANPRRLPRRNHYQEGPGFLFVAMPSFALRDGAKRAGLRNRIRDEWHVPEAIADQLLDAWTIMAKQRGLKLDHVAYWRDGEEWIRERAKKPS
jgi:hypothetical protein